MTYTNYTHGDLGDANPGVDQDFADDHLDDPRINDLPIRKLREIGVDKVVIQRQPQPHWSESTLPDISFFPPTNWYEQDNSAKSPLEAGFEDHDE